MKPGLRGVTSRQTALAILLRFSALRARSAASTFVGTLPAETRLTTERTFADQTATGRSRKQHHESNNMKNKNKAVFGIMRNQMAAEMLVTQLRNKGFNSSDISVLYPSSTGNNSIGFESGSKSPEGAVVGGSTGGVAGGVFGLLAGIGALAIPGIGPLIAAGPIMAALSGMAVGATLGSITGGLVGLGIPETQAKAYEGRLKNGSVLVSVHTEDPTQMTLARETLQAGGAEHISTTGEAPATALDASARSTY